MDNSGIETDAILLRQMDWEEEDLDHVEEALYSLHANSKATAMPGLEHVRNKIAAELGKPTKPQGSFVKDG